MSDSIVSNEELEHRLASADVELSGAEVHGMLCGLICANSADACERWFAELFSSPDNGDLLRAECQRTLHQLYAQTSMAMMDPELGFELLLPDDRHPLGLRAAAVRDWSEGFLYGVGLAAVDDAHEFSESTREALADFGEITRMELDELNEHDEEEEEALMQVAEFLRVATMLIYDDLVGQG